MEVVVFKKSPKKQVNKPIAWLCSLGYFLVIVLGIWISFSGTFLRLLNVVRDNFNFSILNKTDVVLLVSLISIIVFLLFCLNFFEWVLSPTLKREKDKLIFTTNDVIAALNKATTTYTIDSIDSFKEKKHSIVIRGSITVKEPLGSAKSKKSCEVQCLYDKDDKERVINMIKEFQDNGK